MSEPQAIPDNPYVGPRPFTQTDPLFGRDVEKVELLNLLIAERIVLLYSPSGAGKTSLIQAGLIPELVKEQFRLLPIIRVNRTPEVVISPNRYIASTIDALEKGRDDGGGIPTPELAGLTLDGYLARLEAEAEAAAAAAEPESAFATAADPFVLIFDQFEEILTADPTDLATKEEFFVQVGAALQPRQRWALFAMREEHVAALDPYLRHIPTQLATTFRLGLLGHAAAKDAIQKPAATKSVSFTGPAADTLIADLSAVKFPDGTLQAGALPFVEPVQLQVVCRQLWDSLPWAELPVRDRQPQIEVEHVTRYAGVDDALAAYYAAQVHDIAVKEGGETWKDLERQIREWFETNLITERGTRAQLRVGAEREQWLPTEVVVGLANAYLIRSEGRPDDRWYELAHDRLVQPIRDDNTAWLNENLHKVQARARQWDNSGRRSETLPRGGELEETEAWVVANAPVLSTWERELMDDYVAAGERERERRRWRIGAVVAGLLALVLIPAGLFYKRGEDATNEAEARAAAAATMVAVNALTQRNAELTSESLANLAGNSLDEGAVDRALLLAVQAVEVSPTLEARRALVQALTSQPGLVAVLRPAQVASLDQQVGAAPALPAAMAVSADGSTAAIARCRVEFVLTQCRASEISLWDLASWRMLDPLPPEETETAVQTLALSANGRTLAFGSADGEVTLWDVPGRAALVDAFRFPGGASVSSLAFDLDGSVVAAGGGDGTIVLWNVDRPGENPMLLTGQVNEVTSLAFNRDGLLAAGDEAGEVVVWDGAQPVLRCVAAASAGGVRCLPFHGEGTPTVSAPQVVAPVPAALPRVNSVAFGGAGEWLAAGRADGTIVVWDIAGNRQALPILANPQGPPVLAVGFEPNSPILSAITTDHVLLPWNVETGRPVSGAETRELSAAAFAADGFALVTEDVQGAILLWDLMQPGPLAQRIETENDDPVLGVAIAEDGQTLAAAGAFGGIRLLDLADRAVLADLATDGLASSVDLSADGQWLAVGGQGLAVWDATNRADPRQLGLDGEHGNVLAVAVSPDGAWLAAGDDQANVLLWRLADLEAAPVVLAGHERFVEAVAFSADSQRLASGGAEGTVRVWTLADLAAPPVVLIDPTNAVRSVRSVAFSSDAALLAAVDSSGGIVMWDTETAQFVALAPGQATGAAAVAFGPDGLLAAPTSDASIRLWEARTSLEDSRPPLISPVGRLPLFSPPVRTISFAENGTLASGGAVASNDDPAVLVWSLTVEAMQQTACRVANRELSGAEREEFMPELTPGPVCDTVIAGDGALVDSLVGTPVATPVPS